MDELGLFPLGIVLLPTEQLPLHIFEERYKELVDECLEQDGEFGLVYADDDGLRDLGTRARVVEVLTRFEDGRLNILVEGGERFRLIELTDGRSFSTGLVTPIEDVDDPAEAAAVDEALRLFGLLREVTESEVDAPERELAAALLRAGRQGRASGGRQARAPRRDVRATAHGARAGAPRERRADGAARASCGRARVDEREGRPRVRRSAQGYDAFVAVTPETKLDAHRLRADFAVFDELVNGRSVAFLDSAASTQKPRQVLDAMRDFYEHSYANVHRGVYRLAERATTGYETARGEGRAASSTRRPSAR